MKRIAVVLSVAILLLVSCSNEKEESKENEVIAEPQIEQEEIRKTLHQLSADRSTFHFVADWLSNEEILFVEKIKDLYLLKSFNIETGETMTIFQEPTIIADVFIHPHEDYLLLHTTENPSSATVKMITLDGIVQNEVSIESAELGIEWNDINPHFILLTAFHQDWSFDVFMYNGLENHLELLSLETPFPKWLGEDEYVASGMSDHSLDGGDLSKFHKEEEEITEELGEGIVYYDSFGHSLLSMKVVDDKQFEFKITDKKNRTIAHWLMPAVSNYSEWVIPQIDWITESSVIMTRPHSSSQLDEIEKPHQLVLVEEGEQKVIIEEMSGNAVKCSPGGERCLKGTGLELIIDISSSDEEKWLLFNED